VREADGQPGQDGLAPRIKKLALSTKKIDPLGALD